MAVDELQNADCVTSHMDRAVAFYRDALRPSRTFTGPDGNLVQHFRHAG